MTKDMTIGSPGKTLFLFAVPMVLGNLFQQLYNIVDSIIVGNFVGSDALAAVGASAAITFLFVALATGMSIGASVVISQFFGAEKYDQMKTAIYTIIIFMAAVGSIASLAGLMLNSSILRFMNTPDNIFGDAASYLQIYFAGLIFLFMYNTLNSVFNALGDSKTPLYFLMFSSVLNIVLDLVFVINFSMGVKGVAYATFIAQALSAVLSFVRLMIKLRTIEAKEVRYFDASILKTICRIAVPSTIQQSIVSIGMFLVQTLINGYGSEVIAGYTAAAKIDSIAILPMVNVGNAMSTFTAQNIGADKPERIKSGLKSAYIMTAIIALSVTGILFAFAESFVSAFVDTSSNMNVISVGVEYLRIVGMCYIMMGVMNVTSGVLRGAGDIKVFLTSAICNLGTRVGLSYMLSGVFGARAIWCSIPVGWLVGFIISFARYKSGKWKNKKVV